MARWSFRAAKIIRQKFAVIASSPLKQRVPYLNTAVFKYGTLCFSGLDAMTANFCLIIFAALKLQRAIRAQLSKVTGAVESCIRNLRKRIARKLFCRQLWVIEI